MTNFENSAIIIFAKLPAAGKVKTRLAAEIGNNFATEFYKNCAAHIFNEVSQLKKHGIDCYLFYGIDDNISEVKKWVDKNFIYNPQSYGNLGNKMSQAFQNVFAHGKKKVIIVGTDIPDLTKKILMNAFKLLEENDLVISPSHDGGYVLLGMKNYYPELFENIEWSTEEVFSKTTDKIKELGLNVKIEERLCDIDNQTDLMKWLSESDTGNIKLKNTISELLK